MKSKAFLAQSKILMAVTVFSFSALAQDVETVDGVPPIPPGVEAQIEVPQAPPAAARDSSQSVDPSELTEGDVFTAIQNAGDDVNAHLANAIEEIFKSRGRPTAIVVGGEASAHALFISGLQGIGHIKFKSDITQNLRGERVKWGRVGLGLGLEGSGGRVIILGYGVRTPEDLYKKYVSGRLSANAIAGIGVQYLRNREDGDTTHLAYIRLGGGLGASASVGELRFKKAKKQNVD